jgi:anti-sigma regulatory factor (Ser/Thr protein kinase)
LHADAFCHELLEYSGGAPGFVARALPLVREALAADAPVLVAVAEEHASRLREGLGEKESSRVGFLDMHELGRNPGRIIPAWREFLAELPPSCAPPLGIGEPVWSGRNQAELGECYRHEALLNVAFDGGRPWRLVCPYDLDGLDDDVIEAARRSHPLMTEQGKAQVNDSYAGPEDNEMDGVLPPPPAEVREMEFTGEDLGALRRLLSQWAGAERLGVESIEDLVLAVNELATNSVRYGGGSGRLLLWREDDTLVCEVRDAGHIESPLVGRHRPMPDDASGRGIWLVHQLCDLVQIRSSPAGTTIRVHKRLG